MVQSLTIDDNNDILMDSSGNLGISSGITAVLQTCKQAALYLIGEGIYDQTRGVPIMTAVFSGVPKTAIYESALRKTFLAIDGVASVKSIDITVENNQLSYTAVIITEYGEGYI